MLGNVWKVGIVVAFALAVIAQAEPRRRGDATFVDDDPNPEFEKWAALAFSRNGQRVGRAFSERTEATAKEAAIRACAQGDCEIKTYVNRGCIGIARGYETAPHYLSWWGFGAKMYARRRDETIREAKLQCKIEAGEIAKAACEAAAAPGTFCNVIETFCTWDGAGSGGNAAAWIQQMGGESRQGIRNLVYLVNVAAQAYLMNLGVDLRHAMCLGTRRWPSAIRLATECNLTVDELERLYDDANRYEPNP